MQSIIFVKFAMIFIPVMIGLYALIIFQHVEDPELIMLAPVGILSMAGMVTLKMYFDLKKSGGVN